MVLLILLLVSIVLQLFAAGVAIKLTRTTKYNSSWILFTIALVVMCAMRVDEFAQELARQKGNEHSFSLPPEVYVWAGVLTSLCFAVGVFMIRKVLNYISLREGQRRNSEKRILSAVIRAEENQRQLFSKELHDGLGPLLSSAKMGISSIAREALDDRQRAVLDNSDYVIDQAINSLKEISNNLSPHILENFGVARALGTFVQKLQPLDGPQIEFTTNMQRERFDPDREVILYRVLCELVNNSLKHAAARQVKVDLRLERGGVVEASVEDDGCGFDPEAAGDRGMGLSNVASRISSIRGELRIESRPRRGTKVTVRINTN